MLLVREVLYCKPGKVRPMVAMFQAMNKLGPGPACRQCA